MIDANRPIAKSTGIVTQAMTDELLVYDLEENKAHCLNTTAAFVWKSCDGSRTVEDIRSDLEKHCGEKVVSEVITLAIEQLDQSNLLQDLHAAGKPGLNRRALIKKVGLAAAVALPIVASIAVPSNVLAATSGASPGSPCSSPVDCSSGACLGNPGTCL